MLADTNWSLGRLDGDAGRLREADDAFARFVATVPREPAAYRIAASAYARSGRWDKAAETLARLVERDGDEHRNWCLAAAVRRGPAARTATGSFADGCWTASASPMIWRSRNGWPSIASSSRSPVPSWRMPTGWRIGPSWRHRGVRHWAGSAKGLADYRRGRFAEALAIIEDAQASVGGGGEWTFQVPSGCVAARWP